MLAAAKPKRRSRLALPRPKLSIAASNVDVLRSAEGECRTPLSTSTFTPSNPQVCTSDVVDSKRSIPRQHERRSFGTECSVNGAVAEPASLYIAGEFLSNNDATVTAAAAAAADKSIRRGCRGSSSGGNSKPSQGKNVRNSANAATAVIYNDAAAASKCQEEHGGNCRNGGDNARVSFQTVQLDVGPEEANLAGGKQNAAAAAPSAPPPLSPNPQHDEWGGCDGGGIALDVTELNRDSGHTSNCASTAPNPPEDVQAQQQQQRPPSHKRGRPTESLTSSSPPSRPPEPPPPPSCTAVGQPPEGCRSPSPAAVAVVVGDHETENPPLVSALGETGGGGGGGIGRRAGSDTALKKSGRSKERCPVCGSAVWGLSVRARQASLDLGFCCPCILLAGVSCICALWR